MPKNIENELVNVYMEYEEIKNEFNQSLTHLEKKYKFKGGVYNE